MKNRKRLIKVLSLVFVFMLAFNTTIFAESVKYNDEGKMSLEEAERYLTNYTETVLNEDGTETKISFAFTDEKDLRRAAEYITEHGAEAFEEEIHKGLGVTDEELQNDQTLSATTSIPSYPIINKTINKNGSFPISGEYYNVVTIGKKGNVEYLAKLSCRVTVKSGKITAISNTGFDMLHISTGGSHNNVKIKTSGINTAAGSVIATYNISKTIDIPIGNGSVPTTESKEERFGIVITITK